MRTAAAIAQHLGLAGPDCLPRPLHGLADDDRREIARLVDALDGRRD